MAAAPSAGSSEIMSQPSVGAGQKHSREDSQSDLESNSRNPEFVAQVYQRDNHCVITKSFDTIEAEHILAHGWWAKFSLRRMVLPSDIIAKVYSLPAKIDDVRNGLMLRTDLAKGFEQGDYSLEILD